MKQISEEKYSQWWNFKNVECVAYALYCSKDYSMYAVTLSVDMVLFKDPIKIGSLVTFHASLNILKTLWKSQY